MNPPTVSGVQAVILPVSVHSLPFHRYQWISDIRRRGMKFYQLVRLENRNLVCNSVHPPCFFPQLFE